MAWSTDCEEWWSLGNRSEGSPASGTMSQYYNQTSQMAPWTFPTFCGTGRKIRWVVELTRVTSCRLRKTRIWTGSGTGLVRAVPLEPRALLECSGRCRTASALLWCVCLWSAHTGTGLVRAVPLGPLALLECSGRHRTACEIILLLLCPRPHWLGC
jgi:hypothetical protein